MTGVWVAPVCVILAIALVLPWFLLWEQRRNSRSVPTRITPVRRPSVTVLDTYRPGSNVRPLHKAAP